MPPTKSVKDAVENAHTTFLSVFYYIINVHVNKITF